MSLTCYKGLPLNNKIHLSMHLMTSIVLFLSNCMGRIVSEEDRRSNPELFNQHKECNKEEVADAC